MLDDKDLKLPILKENLPATLDPLKAYLRDIAKYELLSSEQEKILTQKLTETGDIEIAKQLVLANLRLVVKIAFEYQSAYQNIMDLIQEGNIGLMKAVSKFDPAEGTKLSYYASWWIRSYILKFILDNFRLVKIGSSKEKKKLFYNLLREKDKLIAQGIKPEPKLISEKLGVSEKAVIEMDQRLGLGSGEIALDSYGGDAHRALVEVISDEIDPVDEQMAQMQDLAILEEKLEIFIKNLKPRDREIFQKRLLSDIPASLQQIADEYGVSRERIRQIEVRLMDKLKVYMQAYLG